MINNTPKLMQTSAKIFAQPQRKYEVEEIDDNIMCLRCGAEN